MQLTAPPLAYADAARAARGSTPSSGGSSTRCTAVPDATVRWRYRIVANGVAVVLPPRAPATRPASRGASGSTRARRTGCSPGRTPTPSTRATWRQRGSRPTGPASRSGSSTTASTSATLLRPDGLPDACRLSERAARVHHREGDRRPRIPAAGDDLAVREPAVRPGRVGARYARRGHRGGRCEHARGGVRGSAASRPAPTSGTTRR